MTGEQLKARQDSWKFRRLMAFGATGSLLVIISYLAAFAQSENLVQQMLAQSLPFAVTAIITMYIVGPIADNWLQFRLNKA